MRHHDRDELPDRLPTPISDDVTEPPLSREVRRPRRGSFVLPAVAALVLVILVVALF